MKQVVVSESEVPQPCLTLCDPMDCGLPGVHGILQARTLEWVAISFSRESSWPRDQTRVSCIAGRCFTLWVTREGKGSNSWQKKKKKVRIVKRETKEWAAIVKPTGRNPLPPTHLNYSWRGSSRIQWPEPLIESDRICGFCRINRTIPKLAWHDENQTDDIFISIPYFLTFTSYWQNSTKRVKQSH